MTRTLPTPASFIASGIIVLLLIAWMLVGCGQTAPSAGTMQTLSASAQGRAESKAVASDQAGVDAAKAAAVADELERQAVATPTAAKIAAAADARVSAAVAKRVSEVLAAQAIESAAAATKAAKLAQVERTEEAAAMAKQEHKDLCWWFGLAGVVIGPCLGCVLGYFVAVRLGVYVGAGIVVLGQLVVAYGDTTAWLPLALAASIIVAVVLWIVAHRNDQTAKQNLGQVAAALSETVDALQGDAISTVTAAKAALRSSLSNTGLQDHFDEIRDKWLKPFAPTFPVVAPNPTATVAVPDVPPHAPIRGGG